MKNRSTIKILYILLVVASLSSCIEKEQVLTKADVKAKVDSIVNSRKAELERMAKEDLDYRTAIEVKVKADSIIQAKQKPQPPTNINNAK